MATIQAACVRGPGGLEVLEIAQKPRPELGPRQVRVQVAAAGVNRADLLQRRGRYPAPAGTVQDVLGLEFAGTVVALGEHVLACGGEGWRVGDRVMGLVAGGAMAEEVVVHPRELLPVPDGLSLSHAAAIPEAFATAYDGMVLQGELKAGERVLVHASASGIGTAAVQLASALCAEPIGTSRSAHKLERCEALGLRKSVHVQDGRFAAEVHGCGGPVQLVYDCVGGSYLQENIEALGPRGRLVVYGVLGGVEAPLPLRTLMRKRIVMRGTVLRSRPVEERIALAQAMRRHVLPLFARGALKPVVDEVLPMGQVAAAHKRLEDNATFGKLVLEWPRK